MAFNVQQFYSHISGKKDLAKKYNFELISGPFPMQCEMAEIPGKSFFTAEGRTYGPVYKVPYQSNFEPMNVSFLCTNIFDERKYFEDWLGQITTNDFNYNYQPSYGKQLVFVQYDDAGKIICRVKLIDAWPVSVSPMELNWSSNTYHKLNVQLMYYRYELT